MADDVIQFPFTRTSAHKQSQAEEVLADDPNYRFIRDLLVAIDGIGLPLDKSPEAKARELYAKYQRENQFAKWAEMAEAEQES